MCPRIQGRARTLQLIRRLLPRSGPLRAEGLLPENGAVRVFCPDCAHCCMYPHRWSGWGSHHAMRHHLDDHCVGMLSQPVPRSTCSTMTWRPVLCAGCWSNVIATALTRVVALPNARSWPPTVSLSGMCHMLRGLPGHNALPALLPRPCPGTHFAPGRNFLCFLRLCLPFSLF